MGGISLECPVPGMLHSLASGGLLQLLLKGMAGFVQ
jgi:hypothetical protein